MQVVQATLGVFHSFELAAQLHARGYLRRTYTTWPWARVQREGIPRDLVGSFPWLGMPEYLLRRAGLPSALADRITRANIAAFDRHTLRTIPACDAFVALSGAGLRTGRLVQQRGGVFVCDRGSTHHRFQARVLAEEYARWRIPNPPSQPWLTALEEQIYAEADAITVPSHSALDSFVQMGVPAAKLHRILYGVRLDRFVPTAAPPPIVQRFEAVFLGQVSLRKGVPYLLQAFAKVRHPHKRLRIVGVVHRDIKPLLATFPRQSVEFTGPLPQAELPALLSASHLLVLPSIEDGFGLVVPQALACGCPVLVSRAAGSSDLVTDSVDGFLVPERDVEGMAARMQSLIDTPHLQGRMSAAGLAKVAGLGGWRDYGDQWESLLRSL